MSSVTIDIPTDRMTEKQLQQAIVEAAQLLGYRVYHTFDSRRSEPGFPDLVLLRERDGRRYAIECKTSKGVVKESQKDWLSAFCTCGVPAMVARPKDLDNVLEMLR